MKFSLGTHKTNFLISALILGCAVALRIADPSPVARLRMSVFDTYLRTDPRIPDPSFPVRVVAIDEAALARFGQWPWPRTKIAELVTRLNSSGARAVALDFVLAEPDRLSPGALISALEAKTLPKEMIAEIGALPSNDEVLAKAIASSPSILALVGDAQGKTDLPPRKASLSFAGEDPAIFAHAYRGGVTSLPVLTNAAKGLGAANWLPSDDQLIRTVPLLVTIAGRAYPSMSLETFRVGEAQSTILVKTSGASAVSAFGQKTGIEFVRVGKTVLPTDAHGELWLKFAPSDGRRTISASRILDGSFDAQDIRGRYILIGATAAGLLDLRATPLDPSVPGVEVHAQALEQILSGDNLVRPPYATGAEIVFLVALGALVAWLVGRAGALVAAVIGGTAIAAIIAFSWLAYSRGGLLFDPIYPSISVAMLYIGSSLTSYVRSEVERARIRSAFSHYVAPPLVDELVAHHDRLKLGGESREVTLLFADVRGFSRFSETLEAEALVRFINRLFTPLTETILNHRGTIDKFMGDAVMAFWNAPLYDREHAENACRAALAMFKDLEALNAKLAAEAAEDRKSFSPVRIGIGLNTGPCVVGNIGSPERFDYSVLGDVVNVAARFEEATKSLGADIIAGETTAEAARRFAFLELGMATPRGKDRPERIFALVGDESFAATDEFGALRRAHAAYLAAGPTERENLAEACLKLAPAGIERFYKRDDVKPRAPSKPDPAAVS
jgi:adenylate cyclase